MGRKIEEKKTRREVGANNGKNWECSRALSLYV